MKALFNKLLAHNPPDKFRQRWFKHGKALLVITGIIFFLEQQTSCLTPFDSFGIDRFIRVLKRQNLSPKIVLVEITDDDYKHPFEGRSPLDAEILQKLLSQIYNAQPTPRVMGVDIDTSTTSIQLTGGNNAPAVIWAEVPEIVKDSGERQRQEVTLHLQPVAGKLTEPAEMGMPQFPQDEDGLVRHFRDSFYVVRGSEQLKVASLGCAVARAYRKCCVVCDNPDKERRFTISDFITIPAGEVLGDPGGTWQNLLKDKIVLVGGHYRAARDTYVTPMGEFAGVEIIANAAQSYLAEHASIRDAHFLFGILFDLVIGSTVIFLYWRFRLRVAFWLNIIAVPLLAIAFSLATFRFLYTWLAFMPVLIGMTIHELHDHAEHVSELEKLEREARAPKLSVLSFLLLRLRRYPPPGRS